MPLFVSLGRWIPRFTLTLLLLAVPGCGGKKEKLPPTAPVTGKVTYKGSPVTSGTVSFYPDSGDRSATGLIGSDGTYTLGTYSKSDGAVIGKHTVSVNSMKSSPDVGTGKGTSMESAVPAKYADRLKSPLKFEVQAGKNDIPIELKD